MTEKSQTHSAEFDTEKARETAEAFMTLWQQRWQEMMQQNGWPADMHMPNMGQMPFMSPFMGGFGQGFGQGFTQQSDAARMDALEKRVAALEKQLKAATTKSPAKPKAKPKAKTATRPVSKKRNAPAAQKKTARKPAKG